jgi:DNA-binding PadR family transcriptional regulator
MSSGDLELRSGDYVFLCFLLSEPMSAYDVKQAMAGSVSNFWTAAHSQVYQQATRLVRDGYVSQKEAPGGRRKRILSLTPKGRRAVVAWLRSPGARLEVYSESLVKVFFAEQAGDPEATIRMLEDDRAAIAARLVEYRALRRTITDQSSMRYPSATLDFGIRYAELLARWEQDVIEMLAKDARAGRRRKG